MRVSFLIILALKRTSHLLSSHPQLLKLQAVICEKDVRFQEQVQKHEEELLNVTAQSQDDAELQQVQEARNTHNDLLIGLQRS